MLAFRREVMDARVAVAVGYIYRTVESQANVGGPVERVTTHPPGRFVRCPNRHQQVAIGRPFLDHVSSYVCSVNRVVRGNEKMVGSAEHSFSPRSEDFSVLVQHDHRMVAAIVSKNLVFAVDPYADNMVPFPPVRQRRPTDYVFKNILSVTNPQTLCHIFSFLIFVFG